MFTWYAVVVVAVLQLLLAFAKKSIIKLIIKSIIVIRYDSLTDTSWELKNIIIEYMFSQELSIKADRQPWNVVFTPIN